MPAAVAIAVLVAGLAGAAPAQAADNRTESQVAYTVSKMIPGTITKTANASLAAIGTPVACADRGKRTTSYNILNMPLMWYQVNAHWCWDRNLIITSGSQFSTQDTPAPCWGFDGEGSSGFSGGRGYGYWEITRQGRFSCGIGSLALHRTLTVNLTVQGGGGAY